MRQVLESGVRTMLKLIMLVALIAVAIWLYWKGNGKRSASPPQAPIDPENMVTCAHCGIRFPVSESSQDAEVHYCCDEHHRAGPR